jgi:very-short-patch-repair endonuclease
MTSTARKLRKSMSLPEVLIWQELRGGKTGAKFRRQHPIGPFVVDFFCTQAGLVIEVDGEAHNRADRPARDVARDQYLVGAGYRVVRISAADALTNLEGVVQKISAAAGSPHHRAGAVPLPASGEDS